MPNKSDKMFRVKVCHDAFCYICNIHECPEKVSKEAYTTMVKILGNKEDKEREIKAKIASQREDYARCMDSFFCLQIQWNPDLGKSAKQNQKRRVRTIN